MINILRFNGSNNYNYSWGISSRAAIEFMTIEEFRETMNDAVVMDGEDFSEEDINELNDECMKYFGEAFLKKKIIIKK